MGTIKPLPTDNPLYVIPASDVYAAGVVKELPPEISLSAWQALRLVATWADEGRGSAAGLFPEEGLNDALLEVAGTRPVAAASDDSRAPLMAVFAELARPEPDEALVARACLCMCEWALPRQHLVTGLAFAEAAANAMPSARYAFLAAKLHRQYGRHVDADRLLTVAEKLAKGEKDWETSIRIRLARGNVDLLHGRYEQARTLMAHALRTAKRYRLRGAVLGEIHHDLLVAHTGLADFPAAIGHGEAALGAYGADHPRLPHLAHDLSALWMELGDYENALMVLELLGRHFQYDLVLTLMACASGVRAAAGMGRKAVYDRMVREVEKALTRAEQVTVHHGPALVDAAHGAAMAGDRQQMERWVALAVRYGERMQQPDVVEAARTVAKKPAAPVTAASRIKRNEGLARRTVAALRGSAIA